MRSKLNLLPLFLFVLIPVFAIPNTAFAQGGLTLFGDVRIIAANSNVVVPEEVLLILRKIGDGEVGRQMVSSRGRYRFTNLRMGEYDISIEVNGREIGRLQQIQVGGVNGMPGLSNSPYGYQTDLEIKWNPQTNTNSAAGLVSAKDLYTRSAANQALFVKAEQAVEKKKFDEAVPILKQIVEADKMDFQTWNALGTVYLAQEKLEEAGNAYLQASEVKPDSERAYLYLARVRSTQKRYEDALIPLGHALELQPESGDANYLMGECYLQLKKGSKAIPYLNDAARFGRPDAHLRLGWLYNAAGLKDKAAVEYEEFLKKKPDYPERNKLKDYISANAKTN
jgi:tetratricopeptide (TPR) repeat protein